MSRAKPAAAMSANSDASPPAPQSGQDTSTNRVETAARDLLTQILEQFERAAQVAAVEIDTTTAMNASTTTFYAGLQERMETLTVAVNRSTEESKAKQLQQELSALLKEAEDIEALVDRLEEYTAKQEAALTRVTR